MAHVKERGTNDTEVSDSNPGAGYMAVSLDST